MASRILHTAEILLTMDGEPQTDAGVVIDEDGRIVERGSIGSLASGCDLRHDHQILMPGVLNCHVHLTDAFMQEPVPGGDGLNRWVGGLLAARREGPGPEGVEEAAFGALEEMKQLGTVAIGEVANDFGTLRAIERSGLRCRFIHEMLGFPADRAGEIMAAADAAAGEIEFPPSVGYVQAAHAPFSVSTELMKLLDGRNRERGTFLYEHLAEDPDERTLYQQGNGPWRELLQRIGAWDESWRPPGIPPIAHYDRIGVLGDHFVAVHLADATAEEIELLAARGSMAILSPYSNIHITGKLPLFEEIVRSGLRFALGTDGRGSNPSVDVFSEARILLEQWPDLKPGLILQALTASGAAILQFPDLGALRPGTRPGLLAVEADRTDRDIGALERQIILHPRERRAVA